MWSEEPQRARASLRGWVGPCRGVCVDFRLPTTAKPLTMTGLPYATRSSDSHRASYSPLHNAPTDSNFSAMAAEDDADGGKNSDQRSNSAFQYMVEDTDDHKRCKWGPVSPDFCQIFRKPAWMLACLCWAGFVQVNQCIQCVFKCSQSLFKCSQSVFNTSPFNFSRSYISDLVY